MGLLTLLGEVDCWAVKTFGRGDFPPWDMDMFWVLWGPLTVLLVDFLGGLSDLGPNIYQEDDPTLRIWLNGLRRVFWAQSPSDFLFGSHLNGLEVIWL